MKLVAISQRVDVIPLYNERRDAIDQKWINFLTSCGFVPILIPNSLLATKTILGQFNWNGILLTGGNDLLNYGGDAPERDQVEELLIKYSIENEISLFGVCRGMQMIQNFFGVKLERLNGHVGREHKILFNNKPRLVNSYHNFGAKNTVPELEVIAKSDDGVVEAICHKKYKIQGIMWHPERYKEFQEFDLRLVKELFDSSILNKVVN